MWKIITYQFPNFNGAAVWVFECISNFIPHFLRHVIINLSQSMLAKWAPDVGYYVFKVVEVCYIKICNIHYSDVIMDVTASQITSVLIVYSTVCSNADQRKHQISALLAFVPREFPSQMASNTENASIWWRHHVVSCAVDLTELRFDYYFKLPWWLQSYLLAHQMCSITNPLQFFR